MAKSISYSLNFYETVLQIHLHQELTKKPIEIFHALECECPADKERPEFITNLLQVNGVVGIHIDRYALYIQKGETFTWEETIEDILFRLLAGLDPTGELKQTRIAREYVRNKQNELMYRERKLEKITDPYRIINTTLPPPKSPPPKPAP